MTPDLTPVLEEEENYVGLVWHECEFRDKKSFTFWLEARDRGYIGCAYLYPLGVRWPLSSRTHLDDMRMSVHPNDEPLRQTALVTYAEPTGSWPRVARCRRYVQSRRC
jgi:hypothetical protein